MVMLIYDKSTGLYTQSLKIIKRKQYENFDTILNLNNVFSLY